MGCLSEDTVLAFADGHLEADARESAASHLSTCPSCSELVAVAAGAESPTHDFGPLVEDDAGDGGRTGPLARGTSVGRYVILDLVGRGGMGEVYAAYDPQLDRKVALKLLHEKISTGASPSTGRLRLLREAKAIARLSHPNVVVVHDAGAIDDRVFLAMEFVDGETLASWLKAKPRSWREVRDVFVAAGRGLAAAHDAGLVHRDFKPQNVMVGRDGAVRVMDFGLASDAADDGAEESEGPRVSVSGEALTPRTLALTRTGAMVGTPLYMAPEQFLLRGTDARTDQFSFCVALYEGLFGQRPFPGESLPALLEAVVGGRVREPSQKVRVPAFLRKLLMRGLSAAPAERFPSMPALLEALVHDPGRLRRRITAGAVVVAAGLALVVGVQHFTSRGERLCRGAGDKLAGVWEFGAGADPRGRRADIHHAFVVTGRAFAEETWQRVSGALDDYGHTWTRMYTDTCEATHVRGDQSAEVLDLRMTCLDGSLASFRALSDVFAKADGAVLVQAVNAARELPSVDRCADVALLRAAVPPPADAKTRARVAALRSRLAEVKALTDTGLWPEARKRVGPLVEDARDTGYGALHAETLEARGWLEEKMGAADAATATFEEAVWIAVGAHRDDVALESVALLVGLSGFNHGLFDESDRWYRFGEALRRRLGAGHDRAAAWLIQDQAAVLERRGDYPAGLARLMVALDLKRKALGPDHPDVALSWNNIGSGRVEMGDVRGALEAADKSLAINRHAYGNDSPLLAQGLGNRGEYLELLGRHVEAEHDLRDAINRWPGQVAPDHPWIAYSLTALGKVLIGRRRAGEAVTVLERALAIRERAQPDKELVAETRFALARAIVESAGDISRAHGLAEAALAAYRVVPAGGKQAAEIEAWLARHVAPSTTGQ